MTFQERCLQSWVVPYQEQCAVFELRFRNRITAIVSPIARPIPRTIDDKIPVPAAGIITLEQFPSL